MDLIYGIINGAQLAATAALAFVVFFLLNKRLKELATRLAMVEVKNDTNRKLIKDGDETVLKFKAHENENFTQIENTFKDFDNRLKSLESIEVPEHLTLSEEITIRKEVSERLAKNINSSDINYLENVRNEELAAYNAEFNRGVK